MPPKPKFKNDDKVVCYYGSCLYEAKILKIGQTMDKTTKYLIHYTGWNKMWDEWVDENRLLELNDSIVQHQKKPTKQHGATNMEVKASKSNRRDSLRALSTSSSSSSSSVSTSNLNPSTTRGMKQGACECNTRNETSQSKKRPTDTSILLDGTFKAKTEVKIKIPEELKPWLVDDWDLINRQYMLHVIPAKHTVKNIIDAYIQHRKSNKSIGQYEEATANDVVYSLVSYFNVMLKSQLLYKSEQLQYADILKTYPNKPMAELYGSFHLLRLFVPIGSVLSYTSLGEQEINALMQHVQDFLKWLAKHITLYFTMVHFVKANPTIRSSPHTSI